MVDIRRVPVPLKEIIAALEREAGNTDTDWRSVAALALRKVSGYERRTLICAVDSEPTTEAASLLRGATEREDVVEERRAADLNVERLKACEHIAEGDEGWEVLRNLCPSTAAVASLRDAFTALAAPKAEGGAHD